MDTRPQVDCLDPQWLWPSWKFKLPRAALFGELHDQYNVISIPIQERVAFHHDVYALSSAATTLEEFHALLKDRRMQRLQEVRRCWDAASIRIADDPVLLEANDNDELAAERWAAFLHFCHEFSFDALARLFSLFLPAQIESFIQTSPTTNTDPYDPHPLETSNAINDSSRVPNHKESLAEEEEAAEHMQHVKRRRTSAPRDKGTQVEENVPKDKETQVEKSTRQVKRRRASTLKDEGTQVEESTRQVKRRRTSAPKDKGTQVEASTLKDKETQVEESARQVKRRRASRLNDKGTQVEESARQVKRRHTSAPKDKETQVEASTLKDKEIQVKESARQVKRRRVSAPKAKEIQIEETRFRRSLRISARSSAPPIPG